MVLAIEIASTNPSREMITAAIKSLGTISHSTCGIWMPGKPAGILATTAPPPDMAMASGLRGRLPTLILHVRFCGGTLSRTSPRK